MLVPRTPHVAMRPSWDCSLCLAPWPCGPAKVELAEQYARWSTGLFIFLASCLIEAIDDMRDLRGRWPNDLFERFLGWTGPLRKVTS